MIAALYVQPDGCYANLPDVDPWPESRDARLYAGPWSVIAHPECKRWGRFWHGSPSNPHQFEMGADGGQFAAALASVRTWGGVLEHPEASHAWAAFGLCKPPRTGGWVAADWVGGWTCCVEQGFYGHPARKASWLYAAHVDLPSLRWGCGAQRLDPVILERHGYAYARRKGLVSMVGGKDKEKIRQATPVEFRDVLLAVARTARVSEARAA